MQVDLIMSSNRFRSTATAQITTKSALILMKKKKKNELTSDHILCTTVGTFGGGELLRGKRQSTYKHTQEDNNN